MDFLLQIDGETGDAQKKANDTATTVNILTGKLTELGKKFLKNDLDAKEIQRQSDNVKDLANNAHELVTQVSYKVTRLFHEKFFINNK